MNLVGHRLLSVPAACLIPVLAAAFVLVIGPANTETDFLAGAST